MSKSTFQANALIFFHIDKQTVAVFMWLIDPDMIRLIVSQLAGGGAERLKSLVVIRSLSSAAAPRPYSRYPREETEEMVKP